MWEQTQLKTRTTDRVDQWRRWIFDHLLRPVEKDVVDSGRNGPVRRVSLLRGRRDLLHVEIVLNTVVWVRFASWWIVRADCFTKIIERKKIKFKNFLEQLYKHTRQQMLANWIFVATSPNQLAKTIVRATQRCFAWPMAIQLCGCARRSTTRAIAAPLDRLDVWCRWVQSANRWSTALVLPDSTANQSSHLFF